MKIITKILTAAGAAAVTAAAVTVHTVSDYAINSRSRLFKDRHAGEKPLPQSLSAQKVTIKNTEGITLTGHLLKVQHPKRIVIAVHGWRSSWQHDFREQCPMLEQLHCDVLYIDQQAHGLSEGKYIGFGVNERFDCLKWLEFIESQNTKRLPIYLFGVSMGATTVMLASELIGHGRVNGIIADCGFTSAGDIWRYAIAMKSKYGNKSFYRMSDRICLRKAGYRGDTRSTLQALKNTDIPFLFFHGDDDSFVPAQMSKQNYNSCVSPKRLVIVPHAKHARSCLTDPQLYKTEVLHFFDQYDNSYKTEYRKDN